MDLGKSQPQIHKCPQEEIVGDADNDDMSIALYLRPQVSISEIQNQINRLNEEEETEQRAMVDQNYKDGELCQV